MIMILGGNSVLGRRIIHNLDQVMDKNEWIISVRDINKARDLLDAKFQVKEADYDDIDSLKAAFVGIKKLFFISGNSPATQRIIQHENVVKAAQEMGVQHVFYTSFIDVNPQSPFAYSGIHAKTEEDIKQSGFIYTILRNNLYSDFLAHLTPDANDNIRFPMAGPYIILFKDPGWKTNLPG
jgi:NAD(P)H dehydrogenase (quinone)